MEEIDMTQYKTDPEHARKQQMEEQTSMAENAAPTILLNQSPVVFYGDDAEDENLRHTYWLRNKQLQGVTSTLIRFAFPDMYKGISQATLQNAAQRGNDIHDAVQAYAIWGGEIHIAQEASYDKIQHQYGLNILDTEYLVSDEKQLASAVDMVATSKDCGENEVILIDIKTTAERHYDAVSLQLSVYAGWFERQNPTLKVKGLYLMWLRDEEYRFEEVPRVDDKKIKALRRAWATGKEDYRYEDVPEWLHKDAKQMSKLMEQIETLTAQLDALKATTLERMNSEHWYSLKHGDLSISKVAAAESFRFNSAAYKKDHPEEYDKYLQKTTKKEYITIKKSKK